jgi:hypothetical protein
VAIGAMVQPNRALWNSRDLSMSRAYHTRLMTAFVERRTGARR